MLFCLHSLAGNGIGVGLGYHIHSPLEEFSDDRSKAQVVEAQHQADDDHDEPMKAAPSLQ